MKHYGKLKLSLVAGCFVLLAVMAIVALAGQVYDRATSSIPVTGTRIWTNTTDYAALELKRLWVIGNASATATVTVHRITSDSAYTQSVGTVVCTSGAGNQATLTASYLAPGDKLRFVNGVTTNATTLMIEYEVQKHD